MSFNINNAALEQLLTSTGGPIDEIVEGHTEEVVIGAQMRVRLIMHQYEKVDEIAALVQYERTEDGGYTIGIREDQTFHNERGNKDSITKYLAKKAGREQNSWLGGPVEQVFSG